MARSPQHPCTQSQLMANFRELGVAPGQIVMLHASVNEVGEVMGGPNVIIQALLDVLGQDGTLMMYAGWHDIPDFIQEYSIQERQIYYDEYPVFDPAIARAVRDNSILAEFLRTWPGAHRSLNPEASMVAVGAQARQLTVDHPINYGYGPGSPLARLVEMGGQVLLLGAPLDTLTLLHYAEDRARMQHKNIVRYQYPILRDGHRVWVDVEDFDTGEHHADYTFEQIAGLYLSAGHGQRGVVGSAMSYLFNAAHLSTFAIDWLEANFG